MNIRAVAFTAGLSAFAVLVNAQEVPKGADRDRFEGRFEHMKFESAPLRTEALTPRIGTDEDGREQLVVPITFTNLSGKPMQQAVVQLKFYAADGQYKGTHMLSVNDLEAGEQRRLDAHILRESIDYSQSDMVVVLPFRAKIGPYVWKRNLEELREQMKIKPITAMSLTCETKCDLKFDQCAEICTGGVKEFSCSCCGEQVCNYKCSCYPPPA